MTQNPVSLVANLIKANTRIINSYWDLFMFLLYQPDNCYPIERIMYVTDKEIPTIWIEDAVGLYLKSHNSLFNDINSAYISVNDKFAYKRERYIIPPNSKISNTEITFDMPDGCVGNIDNKPVDIKQISLIVNLPYINNRFSNNRPEA